MPRGDSDTGRIAKFLGHSWEVVYQALFFTKNKKLPEIQFPKTREAFDEFFFSSSRLVGEYRRNAKIKNIQAIRLFTASFEKFKKIRDEEYNSRDCYLNEKRALARLRKRFNLKSRKSSSQKVSLKSGSNYQFHSGNMPMICAKTGGQPSPNKKTFNRQLRKLQSPGFWQSYFGDKGDLLVVVDPAIKWRHFLMKDVIKALAENTKWIRTSNGRLKGKLPILEDDADQKYFKLSSAPKAVKPRKKYYLEGKKAYKYLSVVTIERKDSSLLFAANGGCAEKFCRFLSQNIPYVDERRSCVGDLKR